MMRVDAGRKGFAAKCRDCPKGATILPPLTVPVNREVSSARFAQRCRLLPSLASGAPQYMSKEASLSQRLLECC